MSKKTMLCSQCYNQMYQHASRCPHCLSEAYPNTSDDGQSPFWGMVAVIVVVLWILKEFPQ